jgi:hypothetical protein
MNVTTLPKGPNNKAFTIKLPKAVLRKLEMEATRRTAKTGFYWDRTKLIREAVLQYVERLGL